MAETPRIEQKVAEFCAKYPAIPNCQEEAAPIIERVIGNCTAGYSSDDQIAQRENCINTQSITRNKTLIDRFYSQSALGQRIVDFCAKYPVISNCPAEVMPTFERVIKNCTTYYPNDDQTEQRVSCINTQIPARVKPLLDRYNSGAVVAAKADKPAPESLWFSSRRKIRLASEYVGVLGDYDLWKVFSLGVDIPIYSKFFVSPQLGAAMTLEEVFQTESAYVLDPGTGESKVKNYNVRGGGLFGGIDIGYEHDIGGADSLSLRLSSIFTGIEGNPYVEDRYALNSDQAENFFSEAAYLEWRSGHLGIFGGGGFLHNFTREVFNWTASGGVSIYLP